MPSSSPTLRPSAFELKGSFFTLLVLKLLNSHNELIYEQFMEKVAKAPHFFQNAPIIIDLQAVQGDNIDLPYLVNLLRNQGLMPIAVRGGNEEQNNLALSMALGLLPETKPERWRRETSWEPQNSSPYKIVTHPIRSGQQVVAHQGDLIILATVSHGAEILAQGNIHVYGALRGRALAGTNGDTQARIFCQSLEAELVSIAGQYQVNEGLPEHLRGKPTQVYLQENELKIEGL